MLDIQASALPLSYSSSIWYFETGYCDLAQAGFEFPSYPRLTLNTYMIILLPPLKSW